jgi:hypothetical protein
MVHPKISVIQVQTMCAPPSAGGSAEGGRSPAGSATAGQRAAEPFAMPRRFRRRSSTAAPPVVSSAASDQPGPAGNGESPFSDYPNGKQNLRKRHVKSLGSTRNWRRNIGHQDTWFMRWSDIWHLSRQFRSLPHLLQRQTSALRERRPVVGGQASLLTLPESQPNAATCPRQLGRTRGIVPC